MWGFVKFKFCPLLGLRSLYLWKAMFDNSLFQDNFKFFFDWWKPVLWFLNFCIKLDMKYMPIFHSTGNFLSGTLNRVNHMLGSGRNNRKIMCYIAGGVVVFITIIYLLSSKLRSADWLEDQLIFDIQMINFDLQQINFWFQKVYNCQMSTLHIFIQIHILLKKK